MALAELIRRTGPQGPRWEPEGPWRERLLSLQAAGLDAGDQLRVIEAEGTPADELAAVAKDIYHGAFPHFIALSRGFRTKIQLLDRNPHLGLWCLATLADPWRVLDILGTQPVALLQYLLGGWPPARWLDDVALLRLPQELERVLRPEGVLIEGDEREMDLGWLPDRIMGGLWIQGPVEPIAFREGNRVLGPVELRGVHGLKRLPSLHADRVLVESCPDLQEITLHSQTPMTVRRCPTVARIQGRLGRDLDVEDCPGLREVAVLPPRDALPAPSISLRRCAGLERVGLPTRTPRVVGDVTLEDCPMLQTLEPSWLRRGNRQITGCPSLLDLGI